MLHILIGKYVFFVRYGGIIGGFIGTKLLKEISDNKLKLIFTIFLLYVSIRFILQGVNNA